MGNILEVSNLYVAVDGKEVLKNVNLSVPSGEVHFLFGPNGSGKSSLLLSILGVSRYKILSGRIIFKGRDVTRLPINERVKLGLGMAFQNPPAVRGVKLKDILKLYSRGEEEFSKKLLLANELNLSNFLKRDLNLGFSGGELKRSEILQVLAQNPDFVMLDEPDSGVDVENLELLGRVVSKFLEGKSALIITHSGYFLKYVKADLAHVMLDGEIVCEGDPQEIFETIMEGGYKKCIECRGLRKGH